MISTAHLFSGRKRTLTVVVFIAAMLVGAEHRAHAMRQTDVRIAAPEARQGATSDGRFVYAIDKHRIGKYSIATGQRVASWRGDPKLFPHINSCTLVEPDLVCANSNYPALPQTNSVEFFDAAHLIHLRTVGLGLGPGSLTAIDRHHGQWWAMFANYDGRGGEPGRDHRSTVLVRMDNAFRRQQAWTFPPSVLERFAPDGASGASWTADGRLTVGGHNRPELYVVAIPRVGTVLKHVSTLPVETAGEAFDWDPRDTGLLWSIDRVHGQIVGSRPRI